MFGQIICAIQGGIAWAGTNIGNAASAAGTNVGNAAAVAGTNVGNAAKVAGTNIGNTATWISKGWDNAARTVNNATGQSKYGNGQSTLDRSGAGKAWDTLIGKDGLIGWVNDKVVKPFTNGVAREFNKPESYDATKQGSSERIAIGSVDAQCQKMQGEAKTQCNKTLGQIAMIYGYHKNAWNGHEPHDYEISYSPDEGTINGIPAFVIMLLLNQYYYEP